ncbi:hypothetical protein TUZN_0915 [Thermoproteus uzoniensis 768-20]|uniref:Uncharacterized protein n=1 Tax=Thermoproteus uzoniensis (strain 768-20) TaxID=999630 RepID=F2L5V4_THEU7|nr:hypothetical protein [Thermoproteus uzoniensis]AEA12399.1 hypothetical protein TUZN_0915 [Thermoproteus uzoniensis 768-20]
MEVGGAAYFGRLRHGAGVELKRPGLLGACCQQHYAEASTFRLPDLRRVRPRTSAASGSLDAGALRSPGRNGVRLGSAGDASA